MDSDYKLNQYDSQKRWLNKNGDYWKKYRESHEDYENKNRIFQKFRNRKRKQTLKKLNANPIIAKSDELIKRNTKLSGYYSLIPINNIRIAKSDELVVKIDVFTDSYSNAHNFH